MTWEPRGMSDEPKYSAVELAEILEQPHSPTDEQARIIESAREPALVVAGAGSGKTETMAARVVWLIANGYVAPHEVLGLTFTRKAAGALAARIRTRIATLALKGLVPGDADDDLNIANVSTYNAFANRIFGQYAIHIGLDPDATVIGDATAWQIARDVARDSTDIDLPDLDKKLNHITGGLLDLSRALNDNVADPETVIASGEKMQKALAKLVATAGKADAKRHFESSVAYAKSLPVLVRLAQQYDAVKRSRGFIEFSDQVRFALQICQSTPAVVSDLRTQFKVVLLDEYQDTSVVQTRLLTTIFSGTPVMAVGDPHQSIYGWRGASATNMAQFDRDFGVAADKTPFALSTSWRNPVDVLRAANRLVEPLSAASPILVETLKPRPGATKGAIDIQFAETIFTEAEETADWFAERLGINRDGTKDRRVSSESDDSTAAMLFRASRTMSVFRTALENRGVPCRVVGLGGLLDEPAIVDLVCALRVIHDATADSELVRLLAGPRWMIAPRDLVGLRKVAVWLSSHDHKRQLLEENVRDALRASVTSEDSDSLIDALDFIAFTSVNYEVFENLSQEGLARIKEAGQFFARLRQHSTFDLRDLVTFVYQELLLDIEVSANPTSMRGAFDAFMEPLTSFVSTTDRATLGSFLGWLREVERREKLSPVPPKLEKGTVQLMTIHAAKGLEWDYVAVPRLVDNELPGDRTRAETWKEFGALPFEFRGDVEDLPEWNWSQATTIDDLFERFKEFRDKVRARFDAEERRLVYVAVTRTEKNLLLSGSYWNTQVKPRKPSVFVEEVIGSGIVANTIPEIENADKNPLADESNSTVWPRALFGPESGNAREARVVAAAHAVTAASPEASTSFDHHIELLLAERDEQRSDVYLPLPRRIAASKFKDFVSDPADVAQNLRRPMPQQPYRATILGTVFHEWVEQRAASAMTTPGDLLDALENGDDADLVREGPIDLAKLAVLQKTFISSEWGDLQPIDVEREIHIVLAGVTVVCKIDAVYRRVAADGSEHIEIVDWKTGLPPRDDADYELKQTQLALYRLAYARWARIEPETIDAAFYFVADDVILRPDRLYSEKELTEQWASVVSRPIR